MQVENILDMIPEDNKSIMNNLTIATATNSILSPVNNLDNRSIMMFMEQYSSNRRIRDPWYHILIVMYIFLIIVGATGNILVVIAVVRKPIMRTARNLFILNLAISDLLLCLITMPLTLVEIISKYWTLGNFEFLCKIMGTLQAVSIFVSTISITAIALDRYQVIVYPTRDNLQIIGTISILMSIWTLAILLASPMYIVRILVLEELPPLLKPYGISGSISYCIEQWPLKHGRAYYSAFSFSFQYVVPILIVSCAYFRIYHKLKHRTPTGGCTINIQSDRRIERGRRMKRTNCLLISIAVIFCISWLPINIFNLYADITKLAFTQTVLVGYAICHMVGMSSACSNPLLYGWLNENFRKEFKELLCQCKDNSNGGGFNGKSSGSNRIRRQTMNTEISQVDHKLLDKQNNVNSSPSTTVQPFDDTNRTSTELTVLVVYKNNENP